ncbi:hypothetical protein AURDEDRAFT_181334 [Auricularia subglabra TFB-10046 SS5]|nr:hypothetical protein AURDEDRAFT_181334 [Auricularia subglabra TFB-10046 SS5]
MKGSTDTMPCDTTEAGSPGVDVTSGMDMDIKQVDRAQQPIQNPQDPNGHGRLRARSETESTPSSPREHKRQRKSDEGEPDVLLPERLRNMEEELAESSLGVVCADPPTLNMLQSIHSFMAEQRDRWFDLGHANACENFGPEWKQLHVSLRAWQEAHGRLEKELKALRATNGFLTRKVAALEEELDEIHGESSTGVGPRKLERILRDLDLVGGTKGPEAVKTHLQTAEDDDEMRHEPEDRSMSSRSGASSPDSQLELILSTLKYR